jgi:tRNA (guanine-N7-)-methyltransferase
MFQHFKSFYYSHLKKYTIKTVHVRGRLSELDQAIFDKAKGVQIVERVENADHYPVILEIGFGNGQHLLHLAKANTISQVYGVELYTAGMVKVLKEIEKQQVHNLRLMHKDARAVLDPLKDVKVEQMFILFPDPWPKKRHHKRRLLQKDFIDKCVSALSQNGVLYIATDWENYAEEIEKNLMDLQKGKVLEYSKLLDSPVTAKILETTFAKKAETEGRDVEIFQVFR